MSWSGESLELTIRFATVMVPLALYFLILGLLNTRHHPQVLAGRLDSSLLLLALSPLFVVPILHAVGVSMMSLVLSATGVVGVIAVLAPRGQTWVIYNASARQSRQAIDAALRSLGIPWRLHHAAWHFEDQVGRIEVMSFPMLKNVSVRFEGDEHLGLHHVFLICLTEEAQVLRLLNLGGGYQKQGCGQGQQAPEPGGSLKKMPQARNSSELYRGWRM